MQTYNWPYKNELDITETLSCDVLVLGGGLAGCYAAIAAARRGQSVILVEKGATARSGSAGPVSTIGIRLYEPLLHRHAEGNR